jgi:spore germination protein GerM
MIFESVRINNGIKVLDLSYNSLSSGFQTKKMLVTFSRMIFNCTDNNLIHLDISNNNVKKKKNIFSFFFIF